MTAGAKHLSNVGSLSASATERLLTVWAKRHSETAPPDDDPFREIADELRDWDDEGAAAIIDAVTESLSASQHVEIESATVAHYIRAHKSDPIGDRSDAIVQCIKTTPPPGVTIQRLLSKRGSQKLVFRADWRTDQREIVLKRFIDQKLAEQIISRELIAHALSNRHPNIIETHLLANDDNEKFLAERLLQQILSDEWDAGGIEEAANLLHDIACALEFLVGERLVHGDIKPDNIGAEDGRYILLDFGICRRIDDFASTAATGSLRTRAPELLIHGDGRHSFASDVWALGATIYCSLTRPHRFPLIKDGEDIPRITDPENRERFTQILAERAAPDQIGKWARLDLIPDRLRPVLGGMLEHDPTKRWDTKKILEYCGDHLAAVLRNQSNSKLSPDDELRRLRDYLPASATLALMPRNEKQALKNRLHQLETSKGLDEESKAIVEQLKARVPNS